MKEKLYPAEENFKSALEGYEAPLDATAFEEFSRQLDVSEIPVESPIQLFFKSLLFKGLMSVLIIGVAVFILKSSGNKEELNPQEFSIENKSNPQSEVEQLAKASDSKSSDLTTIPENKSALDNAQNIDSDKKAVSIASNSDFKKEREESSLKASSSKPSTKAASSIMTNSTTTTLSSLKASSVNASSTSLGSTPTSVKSALANNWSTIQGTNQGTGVGINQGVNELSKQGTSSYTSSALSNISNKAVFAPALKKSGVQKMAGIGLRETSLLENERSLLTDIGSVQILPRVEKFDQYFYVGIDGGVERELNDATVDNYFEKISYSDIAGMGYHFRVKVGRQFSRHTALEFTVQMKDNALAWDLSNGDYNPFDTRVQYVPILGLRLLNSLSITDKLSLNTSLGYARGFNLPFFSTTRYGILIEPGINQTEEINFDYTYKGTEKKTYGLMEAGVGLDYLINDRLSFTTSLNYFIGFENILNNRIDYIAGEGNRGDFEISSKGSFYSVDLGFIYRFKKE